MDGDHCNETPPEHGHSDRWPTWLCETVDTVHTVLDEAHSPAALGTSLVDSLITVSGVGFVWVGTERGSTLRVRSGPSTTSLPSTLEPDGETLTGVVEASGDVWTGAETDHSDVSRVVAAAGADIDRYASFVAIPLHGDKGKYGVFHLYLDSSDRTHEETLSSVGSAIGRRIDAFETASQLTRERKRLESLRSLVSHDLSNPLNVASGRVELASIDEDTSHLDTVEAALTEVDELMKRGVSLVEVGHPVEETEELSLASLAQDCWSDVNTQQHDLAVEDFQFVGERARVRVLLNELLENASLHSDDTMTVEVGPLSESVGFYVADSGPGIPADEREYVIDAGYTTCPDRTGVGLSIATEVAGAHGWDITVGAGDREGTRVEIVVSHW
ncbi:sensor histidine kinase [Halovenus rubra]|uniref:histidine kinase n=2 Tax=Halovenus rubra TaxID=869890 RepID=A0ABD5XBU5_9EURY|nr:ATP-binding protein [Halovenus rubra]